MTVTGGRGRRGGAAEDGGAYGPSILGNIKSSDFQLPKSFSSIFQKTSSNLKNTLTRKKDKGQPAIPDVSHPERERKRERERGREREREREREGERERE